MSSEAQVLHEIQFRDKLQVRYAKRIVYLVNEQMAYILGVTDDYTLMKLLFVT